MTYKDHEVIASGEGKLTTEDELNFLPETNDLQIVLNFGSEGVFIATFSVEEMTLILNYYNKKLMENRGYGIPINSNNLGEEG